MPKDLDKKTIKTKVLKVENIFGERQLDITLSDEVEKFDIKQKKFVNSNRITKRLKSVQEDCDALVPIIHRVVRRGLGKAINPVLLAIILEGADVELEATFHKENTKREFDGSTESDVYTSDCWVYRFVKIEPHLTDEDLADFDEVRKEEPYIIVNVGNNTPKLPAWLTAAKG